MSMNKYMHPRNVYKTPPNFKELAIHFPEFRKYAKQDVTGKVSIDFKDISALRALSTTLLKKDFDLDVIIPLNKLIPTIPLRLNYILWIEDLLNISGLLENITGIDIGTGSSCVYPLIAARKYGWKMLATEVDPDSFKCAVENVKRNGLHEIVSVQLVKGDNLLLDVVADSSTYDFCMCNPPFFSSVNDLQPHSKGRRFDRPKPRNAFCASVTEVVASGGELDFIKKMIEESVMLREKIRIFTTMLGHKSSLNPLKKLLRESNVVSFKQTDFCQGHTTRWGLAWTFFDVDLRKVPQETLLASKKQKMKQPFRYVVPEEKKEDFEEVVKKVKQILSGLEMDLEDLKHTKTVVACNVVAKKNTWSHQRRKKRQEKFKQTEDMETTPDSGNCSTSSNESNMVKDEIVADPDSDNVADSLADMKVESPGVKREREEEDEYYRHNKKVKLEEFFVKALLVLKQEDGISVEISWIEGTENRDVLHQILQYIKNNL